MAELADIKAVDIMNYPTEAGFEEYMFDWEEFKIMARSTFKTQFGRRTVLVGKKPRCNRFGPSWR